MEERVSKAQRVAFDKKIAVDMVERGAAYVPALSALRAKARWYEARGRAVPDNVRSAIAYFENMLP